MIILYEIQLKLYLKSEKRLQLMGHDENNLYTPKFLFI